MCTCCVFFFQKNRIQNSSKAEIPWLNLFTNNHKKSQKQALFKLRHYYIIDLFNSISRGSWKQLTNIYLNPCGLPQTLKADLEITWRCICSQRRPNTLILSICRKAPHQQQHHPGPSWETVPVWLPHRRSGFQTEALRENTVTDKRAISGKLQKAGNNSSDVLERIWFIYRADQPNASLHRREISFLSLLCEK